MDLARRFRALPPDVSLTARQSPYGYSQGDQETFTVLDVAGPSIRTITATVRLVTDHAYFFVAADAEVDTSTLERIGSDFETIVYPRVTAAFGREWSPGVDADARISLVHAHLSGVGGYFSSSDEYPMSVISRSNEREALYLDASILGAPGASYNALVAHELQHLIHWNADGGEDSWVNEGLSQVAAELVDGGTGAAQSFLAMPDVQLNSWPTNGGGANYGTSHLFFRYLLDRFGGRERAKDLVVQPEDGIEGVNQYLDKFAASFQEVFADWVMANYLDEPDGPYAHAGADLITTAVTLAFPGDGEGEVHQFAADYIGIEPGPAGATFSFDGSDHVGIGIDPYDGAFWWSNTGDSIDSRLTREFDLSAVDTATLRFRISHDIERGWDYGYVAASTDGGATWEVLPGRHTSDYDPVAVSYGPGYTGRSAGWLQEEIDLSRYAGGPVLLRFEYVTDDSSHGQGFAIDDITILEIGFLDGGDSPGGWRAEGFRIVEGPSAQTFIVQIVEDSAGTTVRRLELTSGNQMEITLDGPATIAVAAVTEDTTELATYRWSLRTP